MTHAPRTRTINMPARRAYSEALRQFVSGRLTVREYMDRIVMIRRTKGTDATIDHFECVFDDLVYECQHRLNTPPSQISRSVRRMLARCVLLLRSGIEARQDEPPMFDAPRESDWPPNEPNATERRFASIACRGLFAAVIKSLIAGAAWVVGPLVVFWIAVHWVVRHRADCRWCRVVAGMPLDDDQLVQFDESNSWPFASYQALEAALRRPVYLCGKRPPVGAIA